MESFKDDDRDRRRRAVNIDVNVPLNVTKTRVPSDSNLTVGSTAPTRPRLGVLWVDTSTQPPVLRMWNGSAWIEISGGGGGALPVYHLRSTPGGVLAPAPTPPDTVSLVEVPPGQYSLNGQHYYLLSAAALFMPTDDQGGNPGNIRFTAGSISAGVSVLVSEVFNGGGMLTFSEDDRAGTAGGAWIGTRSEIFHTDWGDETLFAGVLMTGTWAGAYNTYFASATLVDLGNTPAPLS